MSTIVFPGDITTMGQPGPEELSQLNLQGWKSVVNFRIDGEQPGMPAPWAEAEAIAAQGLAYRAYPIALKAMDEATVDKLLAELPALPRPLLAHCQSGKRAAAMVLMAEAVAAGLSGLEALEIGEQRGIEWDRPELKEFVRAYVDSRRRTNP